ncbi:peptidylprolyl isomerase [Acetivibrio cellulolyticus]|uniref:peptidylprolyl isomerase n=1 Tax=Acetivibrio cellulolyticus TaxID=35830 RepID=UPI0001E2D0D0|nr:peptidylprolyl isomerase [Acetivibrio cellulolyticus]
MTKNKKNKKTIIIFASILVLLLAVAGWLYYVNSTNYVATIKGEKITTDEFNFFLGSTKTEMETNANVDKTSETALNEFWNTKVEGVPARDYAKQQALDSAKEFKIQYIKAKEKGLKLEEGDLKDVKSTLDNIKSGMSSNYGGDKLGEEEFKKTYNIGYDRYENILKDLMLVYKYVEGELPTFSVSETEMKDYYKKSASAVDTVSVRRIMFATVDLQTGKEFTEQEKKDKKAQADDVLEKIKAGGDAEKLAVDLSDDTTVKDNKGLFEVTSNSNTNIPGFQEWALEHKIGDTDILTTQYGYFVVKVEDRTTYDEVKDKVKEAVETQKYLERLENWKKESQYDVKKNDSIYNKINIK